MSFRQVYRMRRRYRGPLTGLVLGMASLIVVITLGDTIQRSIGSNLAVIGSAIFVKVNHNLECRDYPEDTRHFTLRDLDELRRLPAVASAAASVYSWWPVPLAFKAYYGRTEYENVNVIGIDAEFFQMSQQMPIVHGRAFTAHEVRQVRHVCVIGKEIRDFLFGEEEVPLGKSVIINGLSLQVVGILGDVDDPNMDAVVLLPITVATKKLPGMQAIRRLTVLPVDVYHVEQVYSRVNTFFAHRTSRRPDVVFDEARVEAIRSILKLFSLFLKIGIVAVLCLSVVGIAIVMLAMVRERTAEIGLRKALGASDYEITLQFGCEAILVTMVGAVVGIAVGTATAVAVQELALENSVEYRIFVLGILIALLAGVISGIVAGILPAKVAARLEPIEALRFE